MTASLKIRERTRPELLTSTGQTFLVGENVYIRPTTTADAEYVSSWWRSGLPQAPSRARTWIADDYVPGGGKPSIHLIVRRSDDRPVGAVEINGQYFPTTWVEGEVDPLYGEQALRWKGEAFALVARWLIDDLRKPKVVFPFPASETAVREALEAIGARNTLTFTERYAHAGGRVDGVEYTVLDPAWVKRLGDPADVELERTGTGQPRPVVAPVTVEGDPPVNAIRVGPRVYLRPSQKSDGRAAAHFSTREIDTNWDNGRGPVSSHIAEGWFVDDQKKTPPDTIGFSVCLRENDHFIGLVAALDVNYRHGYAESASVMLDPAYREAGYGSEAKHLMFDYLFNEVGLHALQSWVMFANTRSAAALRKQGYTEIGRDYWLGLRDGTFVNDVVFELLASTWRAMPRVTPPAATSGDAPSS